MLDELGLESTRSLRVFIQKMDKFFDFLNVAKKCNTTRKAELNPYLSENDPRLKVINLFGTGIRGKSSSVKSSCCSSGSRSTSSSKMN